jgi:hypothetical protein
LLITKLVTMIHGQQNIKYIHSFVSLSILIVMYVPFCVFCLIVLFCVLFVCKCVVDYCHRDIGAHFDYPN